MRQTNSYINGFGTAVPDHIVSQQQAIDFMTEALQFDERDRRRLSALYRQTRIDQRHSVLPDFNRQSGEFAFFPNTPGMEPFPTVSQRMGVYRQEAVPLAMRAIEHCLNDRQQGDDSDPFDRQQITHLITVSCTGLYAPGPDIELIEALGLPTTTQRLAINFMGCYGAFNGLKAADAIVRADPDAKVLVVCVELCTIHFQKKTEVDHLLSNALFADGAAAVLVEGQPRSEKSLLLRSFYCDLLPEGKAEMAWHVSDFGFEMTLTSEVPAYIEKGICQLMDQLLERSDLTIDDIGGFALHPGGRKILEVIERQLGMTAHDNRHAYTVLRQFGNMSSATVLFVLHEIWQELGTDSGLTALGEAVIPDHKPHILSCAFGPGLTLESMILDVVLPEPELVSVRSSSASARA
ncbi:type III polyketide synthase [Fibrisoma montanum]|uniref:Type III polyketide synthase n=1 Tax=Fibrisoma montanum TaxID=2305895 RepID=A0A418MJ34_9BACT|nr:type III polyketide synthase [Fibrisoma montanum]RIV27495.1 type III polyketide synthase [Fibrisoma montanum]